MTARTVPAVNSAGAHRFARFVVSGALNSVLTYGLYLLLLRTLAYQWSYSLAYVAGIALAYGLQRFFVFQRPGRAMAPLLVAMVYGLQYLLGLAVVWLWSSVWGLPQTLAPLAAMALAVPVGYVLNARVFQGPKTEGAKG